LRILVVDDHADTRRLLYRNREPFAKERRGAWAAPLLLGLAAGPLWGCGNTNNPGSMGPATTDSGSGSASTSGSSGSTGGGALPDEAGSTPDATSAIGMDDATTTDSGPGLGVDASTPPDSVVWQIDNLQTIGGFGHAPYPIKVVGAPVVIDTPAGKAVQFGGVRDALFVTVQPVNGFKQWTAEVIFRPDAGGAGTQRWFHMQGPGGDRVIFELRLDAAAKKWFLVSFVQGGSCGRLFAVAFPHPVGAWYHVAIVIDGTTMKHYVNGMYENAGECGGCSGEGCTPATAPNTKAPFPLNYAGIGPGGTSIGTRYTMNAFLKGAVRLARFTPRALTPMEFIQPPY